MRPSKQYLIRCEHNARSSHTHNFTQFESVLANLCVAHEQPQRSRYFCRLRTASPARDVSAQPRELCQIFFIFSLTTCQCALRGEMLSNFEIWRFRRCALGSSCLRVRSDLKTTRKPGKNCLERFHELRSRRNPRPVARISGGGEHAVASLALSGLFTIPVVRNDP